MEKAEIRVDIKNKFSAFEQEGDDDVAGELLEKFNQMKEVEALKMARKAAERKKNRPKKPVPIEVAPKKDSISTRKTESTAEEPTNADNPASKTEADSATEVKDTKTLNDDKTPRERVVYSGGKEFTKKTNSTFAAKMMALAREAEESARAKTDRPFRGRGGFGRGRGGFRQENAREVPFFENAAPATEYSSPSKFEGNSRDSRPYNGRGGFRRGRVGFTSNQVQEVPSSENAAVEAAPASRFEEKPRRSRPYRGRGGFRGDREGFYKQTVETEPEEKQYTLDEWKKMQAEIRMKSSLNVAKAEENKTEDKVKVEDVVEQRNSKTNVEIKFGSASYYDGRGRGRMDRRAPRTVAEVPNVTDESVFPHLK